MNELELLAVVCGIERFRLYINSKPIILFTDQQALEPLISPLLKAEPEDIYDEVCVINNNLPLYYLVAQHGCLSNERHKKRERPKARTQKQLTA